MPCIFFNVLYILIEGRANTKLKQILLQSLRSGIIAKMQIVNGMA